MEPQKRYGILSTIIFDEYIQPEGIGKNGEEKREGQSPS